MKLNHTEIKEVASALQSIVTVIAIIVTGGWILYTYVLSEEARYKSDLRKLKFSNVPGIEIKVDQVISSAENNSNFIVTIIIQNKSLSDLTIKPYKNNFVRVRRVQISDSSLGYGEWLISHEAYVNLVKDNINQIFDSIIDYANIENKKLNYLSSLIFEQKQPKIELDAGRSVSVEFITPYLEPGLYQILFVGVTKIDNEDIALTKSDFISTNM